MLTNYVVTIVILTLSFLLLGVFRIERADDYIMKSFYYVLWFLFLTLICLALYTHYKEV